jgi:SNF family Na+-dependent transporter
LALAAPYLFRGFKQAVQGKMLPGISKWDAWQRLYKHLGWAGFIFTLLFSIFYLPLYPWYSRYLTNAITLNPSGQAVAPRFVQSPVFSVIAIAIDLIVTLSLLALLLSPLLKYRRFQNK